MNDFRIVSLPVPFRRGLVLLIRRTLLSEATKDVAGLGNEMLEEAQQVMTALFGGNPLFGLLEQCSMHEVSEACQRVGQTPINALAPRALVALLQKVNPFTALCPQCGELALNEVGGQLETLAAGYLCPFCAQEQLRLFPMTLWQLAWTSGQLMNPEVEYDLRTQPGERLPLQDQLIIDWAGDVHPQLLEVLAEKRVSVYGLLALMNLRLKQFESPHNARRFLNEPDAFGLTSLRQARQLALQAAAFVAEREVTNLPTPSAAHALGRDPAKAQRIVVAGRTYLIDGLIGRGDKCDVFRALWDHTPTERVVIKVLRALDDADLPRGRGRSGNRRL